MSEQRKLVFISWAEDCSRSDGIAKKLGGTSYMVYAPKWGSRYATIVFKYIQQSLMTLKILMRDRPELIFVMTPPVIACIPVWLYCLFSRASFVIDAHTGAFVDPRWEPIVFIHRFFSRRARATVVTNEHLKSVVEQWNARAILIPDVPIDFAEAGVEWPREKDHCLTLVNTFGEDEPIEIFLEAASEMPDVQFYVTGNTRGREDFIEARCPANVTFTGFVSRQDYSSLLESSDAIITLTTYDNTMQRGAYEAIYMGIPVITSDFPLLRREFDKGTVHVSADKDSIIRGVREMCENLEQLRAEVDELRNRKLARWNDLSQQVLAAA